MKVTVVKLILVEVKFDFGEAINNQLGDSGSIFFYVKECPAPLLREFIQNNTEGKQWPFTLFLHEHFVSLDSAHEHYLQSHNEKDGPHFEWPALILDDVDPKDPDYGKSIQ